MSTNDAAGAPVGTKHPHAVDNDGPHNPDTCWICWPESAKVPVGHSSRAPVGQTGEREEWSNLIDEMYHVAVRRGITTLEAAAAEIIRLRAPAAPVAPVSGERAWRKRPVVIEAVQFHRSDSRELREHLEGCVGWQVTADGIVIPTLEGEHLARPGDWIIKGVSGEFYPCKPDIFAMTYERAAAPVAVAPDADDLIPVKCPSCGSRASLKRAVDGTWRMRVTTCLPECEYDWFGVAVAGTAERAVARHLLFMIEFKDWPAAALRALCDAIATDVAAALAAPAPEFCDGCGVAAGRYHLTSCKHYHTNTSGGAAPAPVVEQFNKYLREHHPDAPAPCHCMVVKALDCPVHGTPGLFDNIAPAPVIVPDHFVVGHDGDNLTFDAAAAQPEPSEHCAHGFPKNQPCSACAYMATQHVCEPSEPAADAEWLDAIAVSWPITHGEKLSFQRIAARLRAVQPAPGKWVWNKKHEEWEPAPRAHPAGEAADVLEGLRGIHRAFTADSSTAERLRRSIAFIEASRAEQPSVATQSQRAKTNTPNPECA